MLNAQINDDNQKEIKKLCRICLCNEKDAESPLIIPCNCIGSMKYIHFNCLQSWLKSKYVFKTKASQRFSSVYLKSLICELCKGTFPDIIKIKNKSFNMYEFTKPNFLNYLSLETKSTNKSYQKIWFYLNLEGDTTFKIGRGHDCDIRLNDNSISRFHTSLSFINKTFLLKDNNSKFGTLVNIQNSLTVIENIMCPIQIGRTIIKFTLQKSMELFLMRFFKEKV